MVKNIIESLSKIKRHEGLTRVNICKSKLLKKICLKLYYGANEALFGYYATSKGAKQPGFKHT
jgi:hypothetical protein